MTAPATVLVGDHTDRLQGTVSPARPTVGARDADEALRVAAAVRPRFAVVHAALPPEGGVSIAGRLTASGVTVVLAEEGEATDIGAALRAGVHAVVEACDTARLERAFEAAERGELFVGHAVLAPLRARLDEEPAERDPFPALSAREREVLGAMAGGADVRAIAATLRLARKTVRHHVAQIVAKTGAADAADAARLARRAGITGRYLDRA